MCCRFDSRIDALLKNNFIFNTTELFSSANDAYEQQRTTKQKRQIHKTDKRTRFDGCQLAKVVLISVTIWCLSNLLLLFSIKGSHHEPYKINPLYGKSEFLTCVIKS